MITILFWELFERRGKKGRKRCKKEGGRERRKCRKKYERDGK